MNSRQLVRSPSSRTVSAVVGLTVRPAVSGKGFLNRRGAEGQKALNLGTGGLVLRKRLGLYAFE